MSARWSRCRSDGTSGHVKGNFCLDWLGGTDAYHAAPMSVAFFFALLLGHAATMAEHPETMLVEFASPFGNSMSLARADRPVTRGLCLAAEPFTAKLHQGMDIERFARTTCAGNTREASVRPCAATASGLRRNRSSYPEQPSAWQAGDAGTADCVGTIRDHLRRHCRPGQDGEHGRLVDSVCSTLEGLWLRTPAARVWACEQVGECPVLPGIPYRMRSAPLG